MENKEEKIVEEAVELEPKVEEEKVVPEETAEVTPAEVVEETKDEVEVKNDTEPVQQEAEEPQTEAEPKELEEKPDEEAPDTDGDNDNKKNEEDGKRPAEEVDKVEELAKSEEVVTPTQEELIAQLEELRAEKEEQEALKACNEQVMKVEQEFQVCSDRIAQALKQSFEQNAIDATKTIEELKAEDPAKATLAMQFISQAQELKAQLEQAAIKEISKHQNDVIYRAASREFEKMGLNLEQAKNAVATFKKIVNEIGVADLGEDLKMKVQLAAGRAKIVVPEGTFVPEEAPLDTTEIKEPSPEIEKEEKAEEAKGEKEVPPPEEKDPEPVVEKPSVEDFEEGVAGQASVGAGTIITELNVLDELNKLPFKDRVKFYKEHEDVINKAMLGRK